MITVVGSLKGGTGKSTVTFNLGIWLALANEEVQAIDADPQATLSDVMEVRAEENHQPVFPIAHANRLNEIVAENHDKKQILIDIGTANMKAMKKAISSADRIIVPVPPSQADIWSTQRFIRFVKSLFVNKPVPEMLAFINRADTHHAVRESDEAAAALVSLPGIRYIKNRLAQRTIYRRSLSEGLTVLEMDPRSKAANEWNALAAVFYPDLI